MWELIFDLLMGLDLGRMSLRDEPESCIGCLLKAFGIIVGIISAILLFFLSVAWLIELI